MTSFHRRPVSGPVAARRVAPLLLLCLAVGCGPATTEPDPGRAGDPAPSAGTPEAQAPGEAAIRAPQWSIRDEGGSVTVENEVLRVRFGYAAAGRDGWFLGGESSGGGGRDGGITELYYKPTSSTRNLVFRNGPWGSIYDQMDPFEAEPHAEDQADHDAPDFGSGRDAEMLGHGVEESAGRVVAWFEFRFRAWRIRRTYTLYPWGDITVHARISQELPGHWNYLGHRFLFAVGRSSFRHASTGEPVEWGAHYQDDGEYLHAWADGAPAYRYDERIRPGVDRNTVLYQLGRDDAYSGFMVDDRNGNDPDIVVMNADAAVAASPFETVSARFGGSHYVESALFSPPWAPGGLTHADMTWFYMGTPCCSVRYSDPPLWPTSLGEWEEAFHVLLRSDLRESDYPALWESRARDLADGAPTAVLGARAGVDPADRTYHLAAEEGADSVSFVWTRGAVADAPIDYRTSFVIDDFPGARSVRVEGEGAPRALLYQGEGERTALVVLAGPQPARPGPLRITVHR